MHRDGCRFCGMGIEACLSRSSGMSPLAHSPI